ncbi:MAG: LamG domain-containing protein, partial [Candidatus Promineifilaceae bacterium]
FNGGGWQTTANSESWSYSWDISNLGDGSILNVNARPIDILGHVGSMVSESYIVDRQAPTVTLISPSVLARPSLETQGRLLVALSGTVNDPVSGSQPGSGVVSVEVLLEGEEGQFGYGWQKAALNGSTWTLDYLLPANADPNGIYSVQLRATDAVGNVSPQSSSAEFSADFTPPIISLDSLDATTTVISQPLTLSGQVTDTNDVESVEINFTPAEQIAALEGAVLHLPFDETENTQFFADQSGSNHPATCTTCPNANQPGQRDKALEFDGNDILTAEGIDLANSSFTIATWAQQNTSGVYAPMLSQGQLQAGGKLSLSFFQTGAVGCSFGGSTLEAYVGYTATEWNHWVCTYDADTGSRRIYLNGVLAAQDTADTTYQGSGPFHIGTDSDGTYPLDGQLDEVIVHQRALADYEVANLYAYGLGTWETASISGPSNPTWSYTIPEGSAGLEGIYQINVRGVDTLGNTTTQDGQRVWRGEIDTRPPEVTFHGQGITAYINGTPYPNIAGQFDCTATDFNLDENQFCVGTIYTDPPGFQTSDMTLTTYNSVDQWYASTINDTSRLYQIYASHTSNIPFQDGTMVKTCDIYGHCTTSSITSAVSEGALGEAEGGTAGDDSIDVRILTPSTSAALSSTVPITVSGYAYALDALHTLTVTVNGQPEYIQDWATNNITGTLWQFEWTPPGQGLYQFQPFLRDWEGETPPALVPQVYLPFFVADMQTNGSPNESAPLGGPGASNGTNAVYTGTITTVYVDTEPPVIAIGPDVLTETHQIGTNIVRLDGTVS